MFGKKKAGESLTKSVLLAYLILALHVLLLAGMAILVLFFRGIVSYLPWIVAGTTAVICLSVFLLVRRMRAEGKSLGEMLRNPMFSGRSVEVSLLGGMATVKLGKPNAPVAIDHNGGSPPAQLESPDAAGVQSTSQLTELARLLEKDLITVEEFNRAKQQLLNR